MKCILRSYFIFAVMCVCLRAVACDFFNAFLPEFLEGYTRSVAGEAYTLNGGYLRNTDGVECVLPGEPVSITVRLRNPQRCGLRVFASANCDVTDGGMEVRADTIVDQYTKDSVTATSTLSGDGIPAADGKSKLVAVALDLSRADGLRDFEPYRSHSNATQSRRFPWRSIYMGRFI